MKSIIKTTIRNLILGKEAYIESDNEFRRAMLSGHYALLALSVITLYLFRDLANGMTQSMVAYGLGAALIIVSIVMHRVGLHCWANSFLFPTLNILLFLLASSESKIMGALVFFIPLSLGSLAVFNYSHRKIAIAFVLFSFILLVTSAIGNFQILPYRDYAGPQIQLWRILNFTFAFVISFVAVYLLISLNHHNDRKLTESNKLMKKLNEELDRFVYSTSHDLRAPLLSVAGLLNLAEASAEQAEIRSYYEMMHIRLASLDKFITDITDYSRNNRVRIVHEEVRLAWLANDIWDSLKYSADAREIEFINDIPEDLILVSDGVRLRVVLTNLIANAIRYHDHRKERKYIRLYPQTTGNTFFLHVEDNGQGVRPEFQPKIFDMFFRANETSQGSGLGLYIVKETVAKLSGNIMLTSSYRQGSTFSISLPQTR